jgi:hypothetical protein
MSPLAQATTQPCPNLWTPSEVLTLLGFISTVFLGAVVTAIVKVTEAVKNARIAVIQATAAGAKADANTTALAGLQHQVTQVALNTPPAPPARSHVRRRATPRLRRPRLSDAAAPNRRGMMCLAVAVDVMGLVIMTGLLGLVCIAMLVVFVWYLHKRDKLFTETVKGIEHSCHDFQREINDSTRDAFKSILATLYENKEALSDAKDALNTSGEVIVNAMAVMQQIRAASDASSPDRGSHI